MCLKGYMCQGNQAYGQGDDEYNEWGCECDDYYEEEQGGW